MPDPTTQQLLAHLESQDAKVAALERRFARRHRARRATIILLALLVALVPLATVAANPFTDLTGGPHDGNIDAIYGAGITTGCGPSSYCPNATVTREEMASFLARTAGLGTNPPIANAKTAQTAQNAAQLGGQPASAYVRHGGSPTFADLAVAGAVRQSYTPGTTNRATPIAFAYIRADGTVASGTANVTATYNPNLYLYEIAIAGEDYRHEAYPTFVTPRIGSDRSVVTADSIIPGKLVVQLVNRAGNAAVQGDFQILIYKP